MSARGLALLAALAAGGCADGQSFLHVTVTGAVTGVDRFDVRVTNEAQTARVTYQPSGAPVALPFDFALTFDASRRGAVDVQVDALGGGQLLGTGEAMADLAPSHGASVTVALTPEAGDLAIGPDFALPPGSTDLAFNAPDLALPPLFGDTAVESSTDAHNAGLADASNYIASSSGTVNRLGVFYDSGDATQLDIGLYADAGGHPGTLLTQATVATPIAGAWNSAPAAPVAVSASTTYWIALVEPVGHGTTFSFRYGSGAGTPTSTEHSNETNLSMLPTTWTTGQTFPGTFCSFYAGP